MSSVLISLAVVVLAIATVLRLVMSELPKPATAEHASDHRPRARRALVTSVLPLPLRLRRALVGGDGSIEGTSGLDVVVRFPQVPVATVELALPLRWWERLRSGATLVVLLGLLGVTAAGVVGLILAVVVITLRRAAGS